MKHSKTRVLKETRGRRLSLLGFARVATLLTLGSSTVMLAIMILCADPHLWMATGIACLATVAVIWTVTIAIGCFVMIPVGIWRIGRRLSRRIAVKVVDQGSLWDRWMDGPEPVGH